MLNVIEIENSFLAVLEPFVEDLITADLVSPNVRLDALKILRLVDVNSLFLRTVDLFFYATISFSLSFFPNAPSFVKRVLSLVNGIRGKSLFRNSAYLVR